MKLETVTYYRLPRDEYGRPTHLHDRVFELALRWQAEVDVPEDMVSGSSKRRGEPPVHMGLVALDQLRGGSDISFKQFSAALSYLHAAINFYRSDPWGGVEPYPGRNQDAIVNLRELLDELEEGLL